MNNPNNNPNATTAMLGGKPLLKILDVFAEVPQTEDWITACSVWYSDPDKAKNFLRGLSPGSWQSFWKRQGRYLSRCLRPVPVAIISYGDLLMLDPYIRDISVSGKDSVLLHTPEGNGGQHFHNFSPSYYERLGGSGRPTEPNSLTISVDRWIGRKWK